MSLHQIRNKFKALIRTKEALREEYLRSDNVELNAIALYIEVELKELKEIFDELDELTSCT